LSHLGIDLGTTNCGLAVAGERVESFAIDQLVAPGQITALPLLESCIYLAQSGEFGPGALDLPWQRDANEIVGAFAHRRGAETNGRLVTSAKSWLCHTGSERTAAVLPPNAPEGARRISPLEASRRLLEHLRGAWDEAHPDTPLAKQNLVLTVPASFDAAARELTERAAREAGLKHCVLLEEPQAAFYAWLDAHVDWRERIAVGSLVLVIDVGGGTTDFTLVAVTNAGGELKLERVAVGDHLLLGGDNMDLALAHSVAAQLGRRLDAMQFQALWQQCRGAKERLLSRDELSEETVAIAGRGSSLIGGSIRGKLQREEVERTLVDGFFPIVASDAMPTPRTSSGLMEVGLPYESDAAITRHLARFLRRQTTSPHARISASGLACPTHVLLNGGVFQASRLRERVMQVLNEWLASEGAAQAEVLPGEDLMHAVALGAAVYARARAEGGIRIRGGVPRTYYIGVESAMPAVPGVRPPVRALAVAPFGMEEGTRTHVGTGEFALVVGEPAEFRFFSSSTRRDDGAGTMIDDWSGELDELAPVQVTLKSDGDAGARVRVRLETGVTETGVLELWCVARDGRRWKLEYQTRASRRS
jgi:molecular chaperone DnaK (HSP70)